MSIVFKNFVSYLLTITCNEQTIIREITHRRETNKTEFF